MGDGDRWPTQSTGLPTIATVSVVLALAAAAMYGLGVALQERAAVVLADRLAMRPGLLVRLARRPLWLVGLLADIAGFVLQALALRHGSLVVVQPLLTVALVFALGIVAAIAHQRLRAVEWGAVALVAAGLLAFFAFSAPVTESAGRAAARSWIVLGVVATGGIGALVGAAGPARSLRRALALAVAAGSSEAFMATLAKAASGRIDGGVTDLLRSWSLYALVVGGVLVMLIVQSAYQVGRPALTLPTITVVDPVVASIIGVTLFGEELRLGGVRGPLVVLAALVTGCGLVVLGRTALLTAPAPDAGADGVLDSGSGRSA